MAPLKPMKLKYCTAKRIRIGKTFHTIPVKILKISESHGFCDIFRGCRRRPVAYDISYVLTN